MPFFSSALSAAPPAPPAPALLRLATLALLASGAIGVASRAAVGAGALPIMGGIAYLAGIVALFAATFRPLRGALGPRRPLVSLAYGPALTDVLAGAALGTMFFGGWLPVVGSWVGLKPALSVGLPVDLPGASTVGALLVSASVGTSLALVAAALLGVRQVAAPARG